MNKYFILGISVFVIVGGGIIYRVAYLPEDRVPVSNGTVREITVTAKQDAWLFTPNDIEVNQGDTVVLTVVNEDEYDHGISIDAYGISQRMPAKETIVVRFVATQEGEFPFICSVPCGEGEYNGKHRDHFDMVGRLKVNKATTL